MPPTESDLVLDTEIEVKCHETAHHRFTLEPITTESGKYAGRREKEHIWTKERLLGKGSYGEVCLYRCSTDRSNELQAVKMIDKSLMARKRINYKKEVEAIAKFSQQKYLGLFVEFKGWYDNNESVFIAMEYIENGDLDSKLTQPLPEEEAITITLQLVEGLMFLHENNFVHRDLKPKNIFVVHVGPEWRVKLGDFGISKRINEDSTLSGGGTPLFMAPEMRGYLPPAEENSTINYHFTESIDIWSLGVTSFFLLFHDYPFSSKQPHKLPRYIAGGEFPFPTTNAPYLSQDCYRFLEAVMGRHPRNRLSAREALESRWLNSLEKNYQETANGQNSPSTVDFGISILSLELNLLADRPADVPQLPISLAYSTDDDAEQSNIQSVGDLASSEGPSKEPFNHDITEKPPPNTMDTKAPTGSSTLESKDPLSSMQLSSSSSSSRSGEEIAEENLPENDRKNAVSDPSSPIPGPIVPDVDPEKALQSILASIRASDNRGKILFEAEEYDKAQHLYESVFESQREILGIDNESTLKTCHTLGKIFYIRKNYGKAWSFFNICADEQEKLHGEFHSISLRAKFWVGCAELQLGNHERAEFILKAVVAGQQALLGPSHKDTLETNHEIGRSLLPQKKWALASFFFQIAQSGRQKIYGSNHRLTIDSLFYTGYTSQKLGNHQKAVAILKQVLKFWKERWGPSDIHTIRTACILGESLYEVKDFREATSTLQDALSRAKSAEITDDPQMLRGRLFLGNCLVGLNDYQNANLEYRDAAEGYKKVLGPTDPETLETIYHVGFTYMKLGQYEEAQWHLKTVQGAYNAAQDALGPGYSLFLRSCRDLGSVQYALKQLFEAERNFARAADGAIKLWGPTHEITLHCLFWHCKVQYKTVMLEGAETTCRKLIALETEVYKYPKEETLHILQVIVQKLYRKRSFVKAKSLCQLLVDFRDLKGDTSISTLAARGLMADIERAMRKQREDVLQEKPPRQRITELFRKLLQET